jgi:hypothetical protein
MVTSVRPPLIPDGYQGSDLYGDEVQVAKSEGIGMMPLVLIGGVAVIVIIAVMYNKS